MKSLINYPVKVFATGFVVLVLLSIPLFWFRFLCKIAISVRMPRDAQQVSIELYGLVPHVLENDPNVVRHSYVRAIMRQEPLFLGIVDYFQARSPGGRNSNIYYIEPDENWMYFDEKLGLIVHKYTDVQSRPDKPWAKLVRRIELFAGPEGISETPDKTLGKFISPILDSERRYPLRLYDRKLRRFFTVNFYKRTVVKGPRLGKDESHKPVRIGRLSKNSSLCYLYQSPPMVKITDEDKKKRGTQRPPAGKAEIRQRERTPADGPAEEGVGALREAVIKGSGDAEGYVRSSYKPVIKLWFHNAGQFLLVLDESGRIDLLDRQTLEFAGTAGYLPAPETFFPSTQSVMPKDLLSYTVSPVASTTDSKYRGMFVASLSREGTALALTVFDENGKLIRKAYSRLAKYRGAQYRGPKTIDVRSSKAAFFEVPWAPALTLTKYLLENFQPPFLSLASYFTASSFEAAAGHRALFLLPDSFVAMKGRDVSEGMAGRLPSALLLMLPSIILAILLTWRVSKDAAAVGLSENAKLLWVIGTIAFGLTAYITYRLTRPKITLVTCTNCGKLRRPDMARCHRCGSKWHIPELTPPTWRVVDKQN